MAEYSTDDQDPLGFNEVEVELHENSDEPSDEPSDKPKVNVMICSWNVGNAPPDVEEMKNHWINPEPEVDIVVVGVQECQYKEAITDFSDKVRSTTLAWC